MFIVAFSVVEKTKVERPVFEPRMVIDSNVGILNITGGLLLYWWEVLLLFCVCVCVCVVMCCVCVRDISGSYYLFCEYLKVGCQYLNLNLVPGMLCMC